MRELIKKAVPAPFLGAMRDSRDWLKRAAEWPAAAYHPDRRASIQRLAEMKDIHKGKRCFIIGNGPSLRNTDLQRLRGEYTFGMNRVYLAFPEWAFTTSYLVSVNSLVIEQCASDLLYQPMPVFLSWRSRQHLQMASAAEHNSVSSLENALPPSHAALDDQPASFAKNNRPIFLHTTYTGPRFTQDARRRLWEGATVTYVCLQLAYYMGFEEVILIGVDHSFATKGKPNTTIVSEGDDPNHFAAGYFGKGFRWQLPDLDTSEVGYWMAKQAYEQACRRVLDATVGGKLEVFKKIDYNGLFQ
jgi:hypothetical protein